MVIVSLCGCAGYRVGAQTLYPPNIQTVHVPVFASESLRPDLGQRLTEAVIKQIELKSPFKVVGRDRADTVLEGRIVRDSRRVLVETINDDPRDYETSIRAQVAWTSNQGHAIQPEIVVPVPDALAEISQTTDLVPEVGQSVATAQQEAIERMAEQIVAMMEVPW